MNVFLFLKSNKTIYCRVMYGKKRGFEFSTKVKMQPTQAWNQNKQRLIRGSQVDTFKANEKLDKIISTLKDIYAEESKRLDQELDQISSIPPIASIKELWSKRFGRRSKSDEIKKGDFLSLKEEILKIKKQCLNKTLVRVKKNGKPLSDQSIRSYNNGIKLVCEFLGEGDYNINDLDMYSAQSRQQREEISDLGLQIFSDYLSFMESQKKEVKSTGVIKDRFNLSSCRINLVFLRALLNRINKDLRVHIDTKCDLPENSLKRIHVINEKQQVDLRNEKYIYDLIDENAVDDNHKERLRIMYLIVRIGLETTFRVADLGSLKTSDVQVQEDAKGEKTYRMLKITQKRGVQADFTIEEKLYHLIKEKEEADINEVFISNHIHDFFKIIPSFHEELHWEEYDNKFKVVKREETAYRVFSAHTLRKTAITNFLAAGMPEEYVIKMSTHVKGSLVIRKNYQGILPTFMEESFAKTRKVLDQKFNQSSEGITNNTLLHTRY